MDYHPPYVANPPQEQHENVLQKLWRFIAAPRYSRTIGFLAILLIVLAVPLTVYISQQRQEIRQHASGTTGQLQCVPAGGITAKYDSDTMQVTNTSANSVTFTIQKNLCDYAGQGAPLPSGTECKTSVGTQTDTLAPGATQSYKIDVPPCKYGQLDIYEGSPPSFVPSPDGCYINASDPSTYWQGGLAFTLKANTTGYPNNCPATSPSTSPSPSPAADKNPYGYLVYPVNHGEAVPACNVGGWAKDDDSQGPIHVQINVDGTQAGIVRANGNWDTTVPNNGYMFSLPQQYHDGQNHTVTAFGVDVQPNGQESTTSKTQLTTVPASSANSVTVNCPASAATGNTKFALTLKLGAIGAAGENQNPLTTTRTISAQVIDANGNNVGNPVTGTVTYQATSSAQPVGLFTGTIDMGQTLAAGAYHLKIKTPRYIATQAPGIQVVAAGQTNAITVPQFTLTPGDVNGDNKIDIADYNIIFNCFEGLANTSSCGTNKTLADLDDNGVIDGVDFNVFIRSLGTQQGD